MDRDLYKFRSKARCVAFVDLILSSMSLCICLIFFIALVRVSTMSHNLLARNKLGDMQGGHGSNLMELELNGGGEDDDTMPLSIKKDTEGTNLLANNSPSGGEGGDINSNLHTRFGSRSNSIFSPTDPAFLKMMWMFFALITIMTGVQILAAIRLLNATQIGKEPIGAMRLCRFWRFVCIFFTGLLVFNFLSAFRQRADNFLEVSFLMTSILIRIVALYIVQQFLNELDMTLVTSLPIRRIHHPTSVHLPPSFPGDNLAYAYGPQFACAMSAQAQAPPPKYEDVVKEPYTGTETTTGNNNTTTTNTTTQ